MNQIPYTKEQLFRANARLMEKNKRYREAIEKGINATRYTNPEVAYILNEALEESKWESLKVIMKLI